MAKKDEEKTREYYMEECCKLRSRLRNCETRKFENMYYALKRELAQLKQTTQENDSMTKEGTQHNKKEKDLTNPIKELKNSFQKEKKQLENKVETLKEKNKAYKQEIFQLKANNQTLELKLTQFKAQQKKQIETYEEILKTFTIKNKKVFDKYLLEKDDDIRISTSTIMLDFEYMFVFQKLFEMHVFDYIVDRQNPTDKTEADTNMLIYLCKEWSSAITKRYIFNRGLDVRELKKQFRSFVNPYIEHVNDFMLSGNIENATC